MFASATVLFALFASGLSLSTQSAADGLNDVNISAPDGSVKATFIPLGATLTNFWVPDRHGNFRDVVLGFDNRTKYQELRTFFGPIVGRYANRIANGTFTLPISKPINPNEKVYHIVENENNGTDTLHGGLIGYDRVVWSVIKKSTSSVTFQYHDPAGAQGFPGSVTTTVTYTLLRGGKWETKMHATATEKTPIMLSSHVYWNLEAFQETEDILKHQFWIDASRVVATDGILIPTGKLIDVKGTAYDFHKPQAFENRLNQTLGFCGPTCEGYDTCWIYDKKSSTEPKAAVWSPLSGIKLTAVTDQKALQIFTCSGISAANLPRKNDQGGPSKIYGSHGCFVLEQEGWIDAINNPQWNQDQIYYPGKDFNWEATYTFSKVY